MPRIIKTTTPRAEQALQQLNTILEDSGLLVVIETKIQPHDADEDPDPILWVSGTANDVMLALQAVRGANHPDLEAFPDPSVIVEHPRGNFTGHVHIATKDVA